MWQRRKILQVLMQDKPGDDMPGMPEHQREQPDDPGDARLVFEVYDEAGVVDLGLMPRCSLKSDLEWLRSITWSDCCDKALHGRVGA